MDAKEQFDNAFKEWASRHEATFTSVFDEDLQDLVRSIAGQFYHQGAIDALQEVSAPVKVVSK